MAANHFGKTLGAIHYVIAAVSGLAMLIAFGVVVGRSVSLPHLDCGYRGAQCGVPQSSSPAMLAVVGIAVGFALLYFCLPPATIARVGVITSAMLLLVPLLHIASHLFASVACGLNDGTQDYNGCAQQTNSPVGLTIIVALILAGLSTMTWRQVRRGATSAPALACASCSQFLAIDARFCRHCGAPAITGTPMPICTQCAAPLTFAANFCRQCGTAQ